MSRAYFLTGTDTGVGKTLIAAAFLRAAAAQGLRALGMKPVAAGGAEDVDALIAAASVTAPREIVNPYLLREPLSPHLAAKHDGVAIDLEVIVRCFNDLRGLADVLVVEGAGGFRVPLAGWVASQIDAQMACVAENVGTLRARLAAPLLGFVPHQAQPDAANVAGLLRFPDSP